ncbi:hypothetical protein FNF27_01132 [Cafeteria roenbergensis]|uniref:Dynein light chain n=2 Tax=Cafeteria roenbergensis TaxID=33653 RepID=A0A5A8CUI7_CAFRO|nr:hypothetical protein FNF29_00837 [Cafeteria roenbergensis]KAA0158964.1 hypothetical protein FNF31_05134 [Cafeteria roenbergensis]KAA0165146.1 hypothetical protein FNF28_03545 [Cafeteria roenbergensis]KAA0177354.1 hypothetical protein FNF27_01132 [Cafeteria roenbergensis]|eukprot:KAA0156726.1 hypothetical protein FNF29_00837 [Cafeteria roenbergensis]
MSDTKRVRIGTAVVNISTMSPAMARQAVDLATKAVRNEFTEKEMAAAIKAGMKELHPADTWHCFVGRKFSCYVSYEDGKFIYFYLGQMGVVVFAS